MTTIAPFDVLVLGLGPAGASAAAAAARAGARVLAVDRKRLAGQPVQCAELIPTLVSQAGRAVAAARVQPISCMRTYVEDAVPDVSEAFPGHMLDRAVFDATLIDEARAVGVECRLGVTVNMVASDGSVLLSDGKRLHASVLIGADGPISAVGKALNRRNSEFVWARQRLVTLPEPQTATDILLSAEFRGGYAWLFPKGKAANLGVGVDARLGPALKGILGGLHRRLRARGRVGEAVHSDSGGLIPVGGPLSPYAVLNRTLCLLAGDAAGLTNPITGAGISAALISGSLAGEAASAHLAGAPRASQDYADELEHIFGPSLTRALKRRRELWQSRVAPDQQALRAGWVAYPQYWQRESSDSNCEVTP